MNLGLWQQIRQDNRDVGISSNRLGSIGRTFFLFPDGNGPRNAFTTMANIFNHLRSRDLIILGGVLREQVVAPPDVFDVTIMGAANQPRQATDNSIPTGGGASWLSPTTPVATTPLLRISEQGWSISNIQFAPVASSACIRIVRTDEAATYDGSHCMIDNCYFSAGGADGVGIESSEVRSLRITNCRFEGLGTGIKTFVGPGAATNHRHWYENNLFDVETNDIIAALDYSVIKGNVFLSTNPIEGGQRVKLDGGVAGRNRVLLNQFSDIAADVTVAKGYKPGASDVWNNYVAATAALIVTVPT